MRIEIVLSPVVACVAAAVSLAAGASFLAAVLVFFCASPVFLALYWGIVGLPQQGADASQVRKGAVGSSGGLAPHGLEGAVMRERQD